jgi:phosphoenolpyruvate carboxykinase (GTP)
VPAPGAIDTQGLDLTAAAMAELVKVDPEEWRTQLPQVHQHYAQFGDDLPDQLRQQLEALEGRLGT